MIDVILQAFVCQEGPPPMCSSTGGKWFRKLVRLPMVPPIGSHVFAAPGDGHQVVDIELTPNYFNPVAVLETQSCQDQEFYDYTVSYWLENGFREVDHEGLPVEENNN